jgi:hypothetical protein
VVNLRQPLDVEVGANSLRFLPENAAGKGPRAPLTGLPVDHPRRLDRAAIAVKIDNEQLRAAAVAINGVVQFVDKANRGCDSRGGVVVTELPRIVWTSDATGSIGSLDFRAHLGSRGWSVEINTC